MLKETKGYVLICDCCGDQYETIEGYSSYIGDVDGSQILNEADSDDWREIQGKHYCPDCWKYEGDDIIVTKDGHKFDAETEEELKKGGKQ